MTGQKTKALALAKLGIQVVPVAVEATNSYENGYHVFTKFPLTEHGFTDASGSAHKIEEWWTRWPHAEVGYVPGRSGYMTFDVDPKNGGYSCLWNREECADTYDSSRVRYATPSGGEHFLYRVPPGSKPGPAAPIPGLYGVDRRSGEGGAIWYGAVPTELELKTVPVAPAWMVAERANVSGAAYSGTVEDWLEKHSGKAEGKLVANAKEREMTGEVSMNSLVVHLVKLASEQHGGVPEALEEVRERWETQPHKSGSPESIAGEFQRALESAILNLGDDDRDALWQMQEAVRMTEQSRAKAELTPYEQQWAGIAPEAPEKAPESSWDEKDLSEVLDGTYVAPQPTILRRNGDDPCDTFYPGMVNALYGEPESGKTWIALTSVVEVLRADGHVRYLDYESTPGTIVHRLLLLGATKDQVRTRFHYYKPDEAAAGDAYAKLLNAESALIVLDGVTESFSSFGLDPLSNTDARTWHHTLPRAMAQLTGAAVVLIDHVSKTGARSGFALGAQHKKAAMDGAVILVDVEEPLAPGRVGTLRMDIAKDREGALRAKSGPRKEGRLAPFALFTLDSTMPNSSSYSVDSWASSKSVKVEADKSIRRQGELLAYLTQNGGDVSSANKLAKGLEWSPRDVSLVVDGLIQDGKVEKYSGARGATGYRLCYGGGQ